MFLSKTNPDILHNENTIIDNAFTRPWTVMKRLPPHEGGTRRGQLQREQQPREIKNEIYYLSGDGYLMPAKKGQKPPDLRYFTSTQ